MFYLIDGYNLLYAMGRARHRMGPHELEKARNHLLASVKLGHKEEAARVTVVFDAAGAPAGAPAVAYDGGVHVLFAIHQDQADDLIEQLIQQASAPRQLTVVSDDRRLQEAGQRRSCVVMKCGDYLEWLQRQRPRKTARPKPGPKPSGVSREEKQHWLSEFAELADDPALKELFDPHGFLEDDKG